MNHPRRRTRWENLPEEMVEEIMLRLPPKAVGKLRAVAKAWNSRLSTPGFIRDHSKFHMNRAGPEILIFDNANFNCLYTLPAAGGDAEEVPSRLFGDGVWHASAQASCHGLVVVEVKVRGEEEKRMHLFNPTTKEAMEIPPFKSLTPDEYSYFLGLGYDESNDDYKVVRLSSSRDTRATFVDIYSVVAKAWKNLGKCRYNLIDSNHGCFVNGCLHWFSDQDDDSYTIVAFDLAKEEFKEVPPPTTCEKLFDTSSSDDDSSEECSEEEGCDDSSEECSDSEEGFEEEEDSEQSFEGFIIDSEVVAFGGRYLVAVTNPFGKRFIEIWVMQEYGVEKSWKKLVIDNDQGRESDYDDDEFYEDTGVFRFVCVSGKDKLIFRKYCSDETSFPFLKYSLSTESWNDVVVCNGEEDYIGVLPDGSVLTFRECLLSPNLL